MKAFLKVAVVARLFVLGVLFGPCVYSIEAIEPDDDVYVAESAADASQGAQTDDDSWADAEIPASALSPSNGNSMERVRRAKRTSGSLVVQNRTESFANFHRMFLSQRGRADDLDDDPTSNFGFSRRRLVYHRDVDRLLRGNFIGWYIVEWGNAVWIEPKRFFGDDEFPAAAVPLVSNNLVFLQFVKPNDPVNLAESSDVTATTGRPQATSDPLIRLLEASDEPASRTEWKSVRSVVIWLTDHAAQNFLAPHHMGATNEMEAVPLEERNSFERRAFDQLQCNPEQTVVVRETSDEIQLVGALRSEGRLAGAISYRLVRVTQASTDSYEPPREMRRHEDAQNLRPRCDVFSDFHQKFATGWFAENMDGFGFSSTWRVNSPDTNHTIDVKDRSWFVVESSTGLRIEPKQFLGGDVDDASYPARVLSKSTMLKCVPAPAAPTLMESFRTRRTGQYAKWLTSYTYSFFEPFSLSSIHGIPESKTEWKLDRVELIGLLKHDTPVSYTSERLRNVKDLDKVPTAPLNGFEERAIERLRANWSENVVVSEDEDEIQIVGSLRDSKSCLRCHAVTPNQLLGALTYRLTRVVKTSDVIADTSAKDVRRRVSSIIAR